MLTARAEGAAAGTSFSINDVMLAEGNSGTTSFVFTVTKTGPDAASVSYATADGSATQPGDYSSTSGTLSFAASDTTMTITVPVVGDVETEANETFTVMLTSLTAGATLADASGTGTISNDDAAAGMACGDPATLISAVQGDGATTPMNNASVQIEGIVVGDFQGATGLRGFFVQEEDAQADASALTSEGIFIFESSAAPASVRVGDRVRVMGMAMESFGQTVIGGPTTTLCATGETLPSLVDVSLPFATADFLERFEGMRVRLPQQLFVTDNFTLGRFGEVVLSSGNRLVNPTQNNAPGAPAITALAANNLNKILIDDGSETQNRDPIKYPGTGLTALNTLRGGDTVTGIEGVMSFGFSTYRVQPTTNPVFVASNPREAMPPLAGAAGSFRVASFNVLNYFNGPGFPTSRGADTAAEFTRQRDKIIAAMTAMRADVIGLIEIENDSFAADSALADLVNGLNAAAPSGTNYAYITPAAADLDGTKIGGDEIKVSFIYRTQTAQLVGGAKILDSSVDPDFIDTCNRPALAQTFQQMGSTLKFTAVVNHFKSKGSPCAVLNDADTGDGQGNANTARTRAAEALRDWLATDPTGSNDPDFLILGDLNAYAKEDPIRTLETAGYINLAARDSLNGAPVLSYPFDDQWGTLDYALANTTLAPQVVKAVEWTINGAEPIALDYNVEFKSTGQVTTLYSPDAFRSSDHDPVVVEMAVPACEAGTLSFKNAPYAVTETNASFLLNVMVSRTGGSCGAVAVTAASSSGTTGNAATAGSDYEAVNTTLNWADGDTADKTLAITILGDTLEEMSEMFGLGLAGATNGATAGAATTVTIADDDAAAPVVMSIAPVSSPTNAASASFTISFSRTVTGVDASDFTLAATGLTGTSISSVMGSGVSYTVMVSTGTGSGSLRLDLVDDDSIVSAESKPLGGVGAGNGSFTGQALAVDRSGPTVMLEQAAAQADPASTTPIRFSVVFSEMVTGFDASDVLVSGSAFASGAVPAVSVTGSGSSYEVAVSGMSGSGTVVASVLEAAVSDAAGNPSAASSSTDNTVSFNGGAAPTVQWSLATQTVGEAVGTLTATVTLSAANPTQTVTVDYATANGSAIAGPGGDYISSSGTLSFAAGETSKTVLVSITDDAQSEGDESFTLVLSNPVNTSLGATATQTITLSDNEAQPSVSLSLAPASFSENGGSATVTATLSVASSQPVTVSLGSNGSAQLDADFTAPATLVIAAGSLSATGTVAALQDAVFEGDETVTLNITAVQGAAMGASTSATATLADDETQPTVTLSIAPSSISEAAGRATVTASLSGPSTQLVSVNLGFGGTSTGADFTAAQSITIAAGDTAASIELVASDDALVEGDESVELSINSASNAEVGSPMSATVVITDNDTAPTPPSGPAPRVSLSAASSLIAETGGSTTLTATLSAVATQPVTVTLGYAGTASSADFSGPATLVIAAGATTGSALLTAVGDALDEGDESVVVSIRSVSEGAALGSPSSASLVINDDDEASRVSLAAATLTAAETDGSINVRLQLSVASGREVSVPLLFSGSATRVDDYVPSAARVVFAPGQTSASINVVLQADSLREGNETVTISLGRPVNAELGSLTSTQLTITDVVQAPVSGPVQQMTIADNGSRAVAVGINAGSLTRAAAVAAPAAAPAAGNGMRYDNGFFAFDIEGLTPGAAVTLTLTLPADARPTSYLKCVRGSCATYGRAVINANVVTLTLVDGGDGDDDGLANGVIRDPGAPVTQVSSAAGGNGGGGGLGGGLLLALAAMATMRRRLLRR